MNDTWAKLIELVNLCKFQDLAHGLVAIHTVCDYIYMSNAYVFQPLLF